MEEILKLKRVFVLGLFISILLFCGFIQYTYADESDERYVQGVEISCSSGACAISPEFSADVDTYTVSIPDAVQMLSIKVDLSEAGEGGTITATCGSNIETLQDGVKQDTGSKFLAVRQAGQEIVIKVTKGDKEQTYTFTTVPSSLSLAVMKLSTDGTDTGAVNLDPTFTANIPDTSHEVTVPAATETVYIKVNVQATAGYSVKINGTEATLKTYMPVSLGDEDEKDISVVLSKEGYDVTGTYTIKVKKSCSFKINTDPEGATVEVKDSEGAVITPEADGSYTVLKGQTYSYSVSAEGYVAKTEEITITGDEEVNVALVSEEVLNEVQNAIAALPKASDLTLEEKQDVKAARAKYDALPDDAKALVTNEMVLQVAEATIAKLEAKAEAAAEKSRADELQRQLTEANSALITAQNKVTELEDTISVLDENLRTAQSNLTEAQSKYDTLKAESDADKITLKKAEDDLKAAENLVKGLQTQLNEAQTDLAAARGKVTELEGKVSSLENDLAAEKAKAETAQGDADKYEEELAILKAQNAILKKTVKKVKAKARGTKAIVSWKSAGKGFKYEVYRSTNPTKSFKKVKTAKKLKVTVKKLKKGKTYYFKVRAFKKVGGKEVYTGYSNVVKVRIH